MDDQTVQDKLTEMGYEVMTIESRERYGESMTLSAYTNGYIIYVNTGQTIYLTQGVRPGRDVSEDPSLFSEGYEMRKRPNDARVTNRVSYELIPME